MKIFIIVCLLFSCYCSDAQLNLVPYPASVKMKEGVFNLSRKTIIFYTTGAKKIAEYLQTALQKNYSLSLPIKLYDAAAAKINYIELSLRPQPYGRTKAYELDIDKNSVYIDSGNDTLLFNGIQTLLQLIPQKQNNSLQKNYPLSINKLSIPQLSIPSLSIPQLSIIDFPRFPYRGMHLDVSRHFFSVAEVKKYIDYLVFYKFNNFHWHLTDDQGWRIEIKKYPLLTQTGSCRAQTLIGHYGTEKYDGEKHCGYYTQEQIKEVVAYAKERYINIIPEIEMPGHALAGLASYPFLGCTKGPYKTMETWAVSEDVFCAGNDSTYRFIEDVLDEVSALFPSQYIHIGGDECPHESWKKCPVCRAKMKAENLKDENELQSYFVKRIDKYLNGKGKKIIGWDEIADGGIAPNATIMSWRGEEGGKAAAKAGHDAIMTPGDYCYFDHSQSANEDSITFGGYVPLEKVYGYEPVPAGLSEEEAKHILGAQGNVWTEYITNEKKLEYTIFPRMLALAEVLWSPKANRDWTSFEKRLPGIFAALKSCGINFSNAYYDLAPSVISLPGNKIGWKLETKIADATIIYRKQNDEKKKYTGPVEITESGMYEAALQNASGKLVSSWAKQDFSLNKATGQKINLVNPPAPSYAGSGAFTLANGVENTKGMARSTEFLGLSGTDMDATIDLGKETAVFEIQLSAFVQEASWIYAPAGVQATVSEDGLHYSEPFLLSGPLGSSAGAMVYSVKIKNTTTRFIRIKVDNYGVIPPGKPGAGNKAWLFISEVKVF